LGDYVATLEHMDQFDRLRYQSPERRKELLEEMIRVELLAGEAVAKGYDKDPVAQQEQRAILRDALLAEARKGAPAPADLPESEVRAYFDAHQDEYRDPERRRVSVIVLRDEAGARTLLETVKKATATEWGDKVRTKSIDPQAKANVPVDLAGDLGMVSPPGDKRGENPRIPEEVRSALFEIPKLGEVYGKPVAAGGKFYLVRLVQKADAHARSFTEAERTIRLKLSQDKMRAKEEELIASLRKEYPVEIDDAVLSTVKVNLAGDGGAP
jgi:peptidyl-prolyl cis-trans isomerase C